jgi:hypothetical protein
VAALTVRERAVLRNALAGLYKTAGVDLVREHIEAFLGADDPHYDIADEGLLVWPGPGYEIQEVWSLDGVPPPGVKDGSHLLFSRRVIRWPEWVAAWEAEQQGQPVPELAPGFVIVPRSLGVAGSPPGAVR